MDMGWPLEVMRTFCNQRSQWNNLVKVPKATELYALKWIISHYVNFISIKKKLKVNVVSSENFRLEDDGEWSGWLKASVLP